MLFSFINESAKEVKIYFEPSTDTFFLKKDDVIKINFSNKDLDHFFEFVYVDDGVILYLPPKSEVEVFINDLKVETLYEKFNW
ncbi:hypothetical protein F895_00738 [Acinetobacter sp. CIP 64.2]|uniref:hypothetical protein n=2 Tax=Acinetobacter TaxID=469 RepID=UPI0002894915|nr:MULTISPECIES: hypothetical protein [unclassified Acinetobacter]ENX17597.1 hypothetical protein F895_00738 [Acinetobacter sp. CIP 64.2]